MASAETHCVEVGSEMIAYTHVIVGVEAQLLCGWSEPVDKSTGVHSYTARHSRRCQSTESSASNQSAAAARGRRQRR